MGYDTSFHPVDLPLIERRLLPYLAGHGDDDGIDDLIARAVAIRKNRFRAKAWALGVLEHALDDESLGFETRLHLWGRPFLIVGDGPERIAEAMHRYLAASLEEVDTIALEMIGRLDPALPAKVRPDTDGQLPGDAAIGHGLAGPLRILRGAALALRTGTPVVRHPSDGRELDAARLLTREVPFAVLEFASALLPGWMSRGHTWPTRLCAEAGLTAEGFTAPTALDGLLRAEFPRLAWPEPPTTIVANYSVGGLVPATATGAARAHLAGHQGKLAGDPVDLRKIDEALGVAGRLGVAFCEATEVYSGLEGSLN